ncbi:MAG: cell division ATP-binding protein FtsE [Lachnospiraceae bacterium]|nr:cell division ATP-binding protein FtsE [Lachnospiraceae bacterium]
MAGSYDLQRDLQSIQAPVIHFDHVSKDYQKGIHAIEDINFSIKKGEFVFIVGSSGSGKSTLIRLMLREISPTRGKVFVAGRELSRLRRYQVSKYRRSIGVVFQDFRLLKDRNAYENVAFAQRVIEVPPAEIKKRVPRMLSMVGLNEKYKAFPSELSGGEQQRVALARALINNPVILLADEPTGNLDPKNSWEIMHLLEEVNRRGTTVVVVTHNREVVDMMQKRVITLRNGRIISDEQKGGYVYAKY